MKAKEPGAVTRSKTQAAVHAPHWELASCVRAYVTRSTIGAQLTPAERHSFYPATLGCSISCLLYTSAEVQAFIVLILPDALQALTGLDISTHVNRYSDPADVLDADWQAMLTAVLHAQNDESRVELIESFLLPRWHALGKEPNATAGTFGPWATKVADRAANHAEGRSERQVDRRIKHWTGLPLRQLRGDWARRRHLVSRSRCFG